MLIDWFTVGAQVVNFLVLVWLMKRFLYTPVLDAIDAREQRIADAIADADRTRADATQERDRFKHGNEALDQQRAALMAEATEQAHAARHRMLDEARQAADALGAKRMELLRRDVHTLSETLGRRTQHEVLAIARQALTDLASASLEAQITEAFTRRVRAMSDEAKAGLAAGLQSTSEPATVRSAFDLPDQQRAQICRALNETFSAEVHVRFETDPAVVGGIELTTIGYKVAWSIAEYLVSLDRAVGDLATEPLSHDRRA